MLGVKRLSSFGKRVEAMLMVKKKVDAQQQELFVRQQKLKVERNAIFDEGNRLRNMMVELQSQKEALSRRKCILATEIDKSNQEICKLEQQLKITVEKTHLLEENIKTMPVAVETQAFSKSGGADDSAKMVKG